jgi:hypothetical protein
MAAKLAVGDWIERVYNRRRRHSAVGMISPVEYEYRFTQTAQAGLNEVEGSRGLTLFGGRRVRLLPAAL